MVRVRAAVVRRRRDVAEATRAMASGTTVTGTDDFTGAGAAAGVVVTSAGVVVRRFVVFVGLAAVEVEAGTGAGVLPEAGATGAGALVAAGS
jgi:hypothetical protein